MSLMILKRTLIASLNYRRTKTMKITWEKPDRHDSDWRRLPFALSSLAIPMTLGMAFVFWVEIEPVAYRLMALSAVVMFASGLRIK